jgi:hypothetical protein
VNIVRLANIAEVTPAHEEDPSCEGALEQLFPLASSAGHSHRTITLHVQARADRSDRARISSAAALQGISNVLQTGPGTCTYPAIIAPGADI